MQPERTATHEQLAENPREPLARRLLRRVAAFEAWREQRYRRRLGLSSPAERRLPCITTSGDFATSAMGRLVHDSLQRAVAGIGGPSPFVRGIEGMSGQAYRTFVHHLIRGLPEASYLEVGSWGGSTACAAIEGNRVRALCIDNWSQFGGPRDTFFANIGRVLGEGVDFRFVESDFRAVDFAALGRFQVYLFDGPHGELDHHEGILRAVPALEDDSVVIVDDWNWRDVRLGTFRALIDARLEPVCAVEIRTSLDDSHAAVSGRESDWHNGYWIAYVRRAGAPRRA